jgi:uncharacterized protein YqjF (DUF2071 family)
MNTSDENEGKTISECARERILSRRGGPFLFTDWSPTVFLHFQVEPDVLRRQLPESFELELFEGKAFLTLVALGMRRFRAVRLFSVAWLFRPVRTQRFLNLRTYVRCGSESGAYFFRGWLSRPYGLPVPSGLFGFPCEFASIEFGQPAVPGAAPARIHANRGKHQFVFQGKSEDNLSFQACLRGSFDEFTLERYTGYFCQGTTPRIFRVWHPPWQQRRLDVTIDQCSLLSHFWPWLEPARLVAAHDAQGFEQVWLGNATRLERKTANSKARHGLASFYRMP